MFVGIEIKMRCMCVVAVAWQKNSICASVERSEFFEMQIISGETQTSRKSWIAQLIGSKSLLEKYEIELA